MITDLLNIIFDYVGSTYQEYLLDCEIETLQHKLDRLKKEKHDTVSKRYENFIYNDIREHVQSKQYKFCVVYDRYPQYLGNLLKKNYKVRFDMKYRAIEVHHDHSIHMPRRILHRDHVIYCYADMLANRIKYTCTGINSHYVQCLKITVRPGKM